MKLSCPSPLQALLEGGGECGRGAVPPQLGALGGLLLREPREAAYSSATGPRVPAAPAGPEPTAPALHAAPATVAQRDHHAATHDYLYSPSTGEVNKSTFSPSMTFVFMSGRTRRYEMC